jgi:hypothetical protein
MKKLFFAFAIVLLSVNAKAQLIDLKNLDLSSLLGKVMKVKQGWAPKFSFGNLDISKIAKVGKIVNLKNVTTATKLFNTFKAGRTIYKAGAYIGLATTAYSSIKNIVQSNKEALTTEAQRLKSEGIKQAQKFALAGGGTILTGVLIKLLTKKAASKAADAFNGVVRKKIQDILSFDAPTTSPYTTAGLALKIKL